MAHSLAQNPATVSYCTWKKIKLIITANNTQHNLALLPHLTSYSFPLTYSSLVMQWPSLQHSNMPNSFYLECSFRTHGSFLSFTFYFKCRLPERQLNVSQPSPRKQPTKHPLSLHCHSLSSQQFSLSGIYSLVTTNLLFVALLENALPREHGPCLIYYWIDQDRTAVSSRLESQGTLPKAGAMGRRAFAQRKIKESPLILLFLPLHPQPHPSTRTDSNSISKYTQFSTREYSEPGSASLHLLQKFQSKLMPFLP